MLKQILYRLLMVVVLCGLGWQAQAQEVVLQASVFSAGGQHSSGGGVVLQSTLGQAGVGPMTSPEKLLQGGFWPPAASAAAPLAVPVAVDDAQTTDEDTPASIDVLANDTDPSGGVLSIFDFGQAEHGRVTQENETTFSYIPEDDFYGEDRFIYVVENERGGLSGATVTITVRSVNDVPVFVSAPVAAAVIQAEYRYVVKARDVDEEPLMFTATKIPSWLSLAGQTDSTAILAGIPSLDAAGAHTVTLVVSDGGALAEQSFTLTVTGAVPGLSTLLLPENEAEVDPAGGIVLAWRAVSGASSYNLELSTVEDFSTFESSIIGLTDTTWTFHSLKHSTGYFWRIRAVNSIGNGDFTEAFRFSTVVNVATEGEGDVPKTFELRQNYPNPFNPTTTIAYELPQAAEVRMVVYDLYGRAIRTLVQRSQPAGRYEVVFEVGSLASGTYFYRIEAGTWSHVRQLVLLK